ASRRDRGIWAAECQLRKKDFPRRELDYRVLERRKSQPGQAAARSQFALFDKGRALRLMLLNLRWMGKAKDSAKRDLRKASRSPCGCVRVMFPVGSCRV